MLILSGEGRVTKTPELRTTASGELMTTVTVASNGGGSEDTAIYVDLVLWEVQAAFAARHLTKGWNITFSGHLRPAAGNGPNGEHQEAVQICNVRLDYGPKPPPVDEPDKQVGAMSSNGSPIEGTDVVDHVMTNQDCRDVLEAKLQFKPAIAVVEGLARQELGESWLKTINARRQDTGHPVISGLDAKSALSELWHTPQLRDRIGDERAQRALDLNNIINTADHDNVKGTWRAGNAARATQLAQQLRSDLERGRFDSPESTARTPGAQVAILRSTRAGEYSGQSGQARGEDCHQRAMNLYEIGRYKEAARLFQEAVAAKQRGDENGLPDDQSIAKSMAAVGDCCSARGAHDQASLWRSKAADAKRKGYDTTRLRDTGAAAAADPAPAPAGPEPATAAPPAEPAPAPDPGGSHGHGTIRLRSPGEGRPPRTTLSATNGSSQASTGPPQISSEIARLEAAAKEAWAAVQAYRPVPGASLAGRTELMNKATQAAQRLTAAKAA